MNYSVSPRVVTSGNKLQQLSNTKYITTTTHIVTILAACFRNTEEKKKEKTTGYDNTVIETLLQAIINRGIQYQASNIKSPYMIKSHLTYITGGYVIPGNKRY